MLPLLIEVMLEICTQKRSVKIINEKRGGNIVMVTTMTVRIVVAVVIEVNIEVSIEVAARITVTGETMIITVLHEAAAVIAMNEVGVALIGTITISLFVTLKIKKKMLKLGIEPKTFALLARRSNQLSYSSTELVPSVCYINQSFSCLTHSNARLISSFA